ncbi:MAG: dethiobiotin synthase [Pusillimonas sp.]|nr:dethiobiotin synthase [Pusillimonas sp.]MBC42274.1 dethiobiotin synthase [Pusillimonas sp.]HCP78521.1 dethiobiotin synthase [Pusillimonas sp.]
MSVSKIALFVTGTDTEIGKTLVSSALLYAFVQAGLRVAAMKPVAAGVTLHNGVRVNEDIELLRAQANIELPEHEMSPYLWDEPIAPHIAAQKRGVVMRAEVIRQAYLAAAQRADAIIVEGVGGFCVPLSSEENMADVAVSLNLPVVMVVGMRLGCINHALLTAEAIRARGLTLAAWVANTVDRNMPYRDENIQTLSEALAAPCLGRIPHFDTPSAELAVGYLDISCLQVG